jgi:Sulfotransferase domain
MIWDGFFAGRFADREHAIAAYDRHNREVIAELPPERLLVITPGAGWAPLCDFLGVPVPDEPYPHLNDPEKFWARVQARVAESQTAG